MPHPPFVADTFMTIGVTLPINEYNALRSMASTLGLRPSWRSLVVALAQHDILVFGAYGPQPAAPTGEKSTVSVRRSLERPLRALAADMRTYGYHGLPSVSSLLHGIAIGALTSRRIGFPIPPNSEATNAHHPDQ